MSVETQAHTTDTSPLALLAWGAGENSFLSLLATIEQEAEHIDDKVVRDFAIVCLNGRLAHDAASNNTHLENYLKELPDEIEIGEFKRANHASINGLNTPSDQVLFLRENPGIISTETARNTHATNWDTRTAIDLEVRSSLDAMAETQKYKDDPRYKIRQFGEYNIEKQDPSPLVMIERKRIVRSHFGGEILSVIKNSLILNGQDSTMPDELRRYLLAQKDKSLNQPKQFSYKANHATIKEYVEPHMLNRENTDKPTWPLPLVTTYYAHVNPNFHATRQEVDS